MSYECHLTLIPPKTYADRLALEELARRHRFKTSYIVGDPVLGDEKYFYMTGHDKDFEAMRTRMDALANDVSGLGHARTVRKKIEHIVLDERIPSWV